MTYVQIVDNSSLKFGKNTLVNRLATLNNLINYDWLNLSYGSFKIKCKDQKSKLSKTDKYSHKAFDNIYSIM